MAKKTPGPKKTLEASSSQPLQELQAEAREAEAEAEGMEQLEAGTEGVSQRT